MKFRFRLCRAARLALLPLLALPLLAASAASAAKTPAATTQTSAADKTAPAPAEPLRIDVGPVLQAPTAHELTVTWLTNALSTGVVEYGPVGGELRTASTAAHGLIAVAARTHKVVLRDLQPGTTYRYRVLARAIANFKHSRVEFGATAASAFRPFRVPATQPERFAFLVFNDVHDQPATFPELLKVAPQQPYDLVVLNGDIMSYIGQEAQILPILQTVAQAFAGEVPLLWVRGNHETRGLFARQFPAYIGMLQERYYGAFDYGPVHFLVLDTGEDKIDGHREYGGLVDFARYREEEGRWLKTAVQSEAFRRAKYRVVIAHMPFPTAAANNADGHGEKGVFLGMGDAYQNFGPTLEAAGIDIMFCGHKHAAEIYEAEAGRHTYPIVQGGGNKGVGRTLIRADVTAEALTATIYRADGTVFGSRVVRARR